MLEAARQRVIDRGKLALELLAQWSLDDATFEQRVECVLLSSGCLEPGPDTAGFVRDAAEHAREHFRESACE